MWINAHTWYTWTRQFHPDSLLRSRPLSNWEPNSWPVPSRFSHSTSAGPYTLRSGLKSFNHNLNDNIETKSKNIQIPFRFRFSASATWKSITFLHSLGGKYCNVSGNSGIPGNWAVLGSLLISSLFFAPSNTKALMNKIWVASSSTGFEVDTKYYSSLACIFVLF